MRNYPNICKMTTLAAVLSLSYSAAVLADQNTSTTAQSGAQQSATQQSAMTSERFNNLREKTVSARDLLNATVENVGNPVGHVRDLVLNEDGTAVQYVLYQIPFPYSVTGAVSPQNGFVAYDNLDIEPGAGFNDYVRFAGQASPQAPQQLTIDRAEADNRLVSRLLDDTVTFSGDTARSVQDILIDRDSGKIAGYVINKDPNSWFNDQPLVIPASKVQISKGGNVTTSADFASLETIH